MTEQLKPCPFCGGKAELITDSIKREVSISCCRCPALFNQTTYLISFNELKSLVINAWNLRINESTKHINEIQLQNIDEFINIFNKCVQKSADSLAKLNDVVKQLRDEHD